MCVFNNNGLRGNRDYAEHFTYGDLAAEVPFDNEIVVVPMPGRVLADAIAASRAKAPAESGGFLQVDDRVVVAEPAHGLTQVAGALFDPKRVYRVALVRNLFDGMDHVQPLVDFAHAQGESLPKPTIGRGPRLVLVESFCRELFRKLGDFDAIDLNHDGFLDAAEMAAAIERVTREPASKVTIDLILRTLGAEDGAALPRRLVVPTS
jgi:hypothetical protein